MQLNDKIDNVSLMSADLPQYILIGVIVILTVVLIVLGIQIFFILKESKETLQKVNKILDGASGVIGSSALFKNPIVKILAGTALTFFTGQKKLKEKNQKPISLNTTRPKEQKTKRFFRRSLR